MKRFRSLTTLTISVCVLLMLSLAASADPSVAKTAPGQSVSLGLASPTEPFWAPTFTLPHDTTITLCSSDSVCYPISGSDVDAGDSLKLWLVSGPITYTPTTFGQQFSTTVCFKPATSGTYTFIWKLTDKQAHIVKDTVTFTVIVNHPPVISDQSFSTVICYQPYEISYQLVATDVDQDHLTYKLISGEGTLSSTGLLTYTPTSAGIHAFVVSVSDGCGADTATITDTVKMNLPPSLTWRDSLVHVCDRSQICFDAVALDPEHGPTTITLVEWPEGVTVGPDRNGHVCFTPNADSATYQFVFCLTDECPIDSAGAKMLQSPICFRDTIRYTVVVNHLPVISDQSFRAEFCYQTSEITHQLVAGDVDHDQLTFKLISGNATLSSTGLLAYTPTSAGIYTFVVSVSDLCGADTATITDTVKMNLPPSLTWRDSLVHVCERSVICFDAVAHDPEGGPTTITLMEWPEAVTVGPDRNGHVCFTPNADSATYEFVFCLTDECPLDSAGAKVLHSPICVRDTIRYTVVVNRGPKIVCPEGQQFFGCKTGPFCFDINATDPDGDSISFSVLSANATITGNKVCFTGSEPGNYTVVVAASDKCGHADTCSIPVEIKGGRPPVVTLPADFAVSICQPEDICFQAYADDPDNDIKTVVVNYGSYEKSQNRICIHADTTGLYRITMLATDSCGLYSMDTIDVQVKVNGLPSVRFEKHADTSLCFSGQLCYNVAISDDNLKNVFTSFGLYNAATGQVCFTPDTSGLYTVIVSAVDDCNKTVADTLHVTVTVNNPPVISGMHDTTLYLCKPQYVCVPVIVTDRDNNLKAVTVNRGKYENNTVCFVPYNQGTYPIIVTAVDNCGAIVVDTAIVTVRTDQEVVIGYPKDTTIQLCRPDTLCFPVSGVPADAKVTLKGTNVWWNAQAQTVCFYSDCCLQNTIAVTVTTACGTVKTGVFTVKVQTDSAPLVLLPQDTTINSCDGFSACFPVGISDLDHNVASVQVTGGQYDAYRQQVCVSGDTTGYYTISVTAIDSCGLSATRQMHVRLNKNSGPTIVFGDVNTQYNFCAPTEICLPVISSDPNGNIKSIVPSLGTYNPTKKSICFTPTEARQYCVTVTVTDSCGAQATADLCVNVTFGNTVSLQCPTEWITPFLLCGVDSICIPIQIDGTPIQVTTSRGVYKDGKVCFKVDTSGSYAVTVIAQASCNADTCSFTVPVIVQAGVHVVCGVSDTSLFRCATGDTLRFPVTITGDPTTITVTPAGAHYANGFVFVPVTSSGIVTVTTVAANQCSSDSCSFNVHITINQPPTVTIISDTSVVACGALGPIKLPFRLSDPDNNITEIRTTLGDIDDTTVNFTPTQSGDYQVIITVLDACGAKAVDTSNLHISISPKVAITCPGAAIPVSVTLPDSVRVKIPVTPADAIVTILPNGRYDAATGEAVVFVDSVGVRSFRLIARGACDSAVCNFVIDTKQYIPPTVQCRGSIDTLLCLSQPTSVCMPVTIFGDSVQVKVFPSGTYADGQVCFPVTTAGNYHVGIVAYNSKSADTCYTDLTVRGGNRPVVAPPSPYTVNLCGAGQVCFDVNVSDPDGDLKSITTDRGTLSRTQAGVHICFDAANAPSTIYSVAITAVDSCGLITTDTARITVTIPTQSLVHLGDDKVIGTCLSSQICVPIWFTNGEPDTLTITGGQLNDQRNAVCFTATEAGIHRIIARGSDKCGRIQADTVDVTITLNTPPTISGFRDTTVYMCVPRNICLPITINDADHNIKSVTVNRGQYTNGTICFVPYTMGTYPIIVTVTDSCGQVDVDTAIVNILTDQQVNITFPKDTSIFQCTADTLCFPVFGVPSDATVKVIGTNVHWDKNKQAVCFYSDCCLQNTITVQVTTACGTVKSGVFTVKVQTNSAPLVILPRDTSIIQCAPTKVCFPIGVSDIDNNVTSINVTGATYNDQAKTVCLTPNGAGNYTIVVKVTDACGLSTTRQFTVTIRDNAKPVLSYVAHDTLYSQCAFTQICLPVGITDPDGNLANVTVRGGTYDAKNGTICILPTDTGNVCAMVTATDSCGLSDSVQVCVHVKAGGVADIQCPTSPITLTKLCKADSVFVPVTITGHDYVVTTNFGKYDGGSVRFKADTSGTYTIRVIASAQCISDTCTLSVPVQILPLVDITCPGNQTVFLCAPDTLCYNFTTSASVTSVKVQGAAYVNGNSVCIPAFIAGTRTITLIATGQCGADTCSFTFTCSFNSAPTITARDTAMTICNLPEICIPFTAADANKNTLSITTSVGHISGSSVCFTPTAFGETSITLTVTDSCGAQASRVVKAVITEGAKAQITCPDNTQMWLCKPDTVYIIAPITPANATVTILPAGKYNPATGKVAVYINKSGTYPITVIAAAQCASDTCNFSIAVDMGQAPTVSAPARIDSTMCLVSPTTLCFPATVTGTGVQVVVSPSGGSYSAGTVCIPVSSPGSFYVKLTATGTCGVATCSTLVNVTANQAPVITLPTVTTIQRCPQDTNTICVSGITATDAEGKPITITMTCGPGTLTTTTPGNATICFKPSSITSQTFCISATDGCQTTTRQLIVPIVQRADCDVCQKVKFDGGLCTVVGVNKGVDIKVTSYTTIGGFDLLFKYDASALSFRSAVITNSAITGWEYFTYNLNNGACGSSCPSGLVRLVGIADVNNGAHHPPDSTLLPNGVLVHVEFAVANNQNLGGQFVPLQWVWYDCGDNSFSDPTGNYLYVDNRIYNYENVVIWDENDNVNYPEAARPFGVGAQDACFSATAKSQPQRCVEFYDGGICIIHPDSIDARGDINLNNVAYEIGDAVVFTNYFVKGISAFKINVQGQIAASDVNADGLTLTVADLTLLIRVIIGDAQPIPKVVPYPEKLVVKTTSDNGAINLTTDAAGTIGAAYFVFDIGDHTTIGTPQLTDASQGMDLLYSVDGSQLKVLVYNIGTHRIGAGEHSILQIPYTGDGAISVSMVDAADYDGQPYEVAARTANLPTSFGLDQNYPNPFNPTTTIGFALPVASKWNLQIYNVSGSLVREFNGSGDAGTYQIEWDGRAQDGHATASGVYFYRLEAGSYTRTMKMVLLK